MKTVLSVLFALTVLPSESLAQVPLSTRVWGTDGVKNATTTWQKIYIGRPSVWKDVTVTNYDTDTDTVKIALSISDTTSRVNHLYLMQAERLSITSVRSDTLWYLSTGTSAILIKAVNR